MYISSFLCPLLVDSDSHGVCEVNVYFTQVASYIVYIQFRFICIYRLTAQLQLSWWTLQFVQYYTL